MWVMQHISQTILKKIRIYSWLSLCAKGSKLEFTLTVTPKTDQQRQFFPRCFNLRSSYFFSIIMYWTQVKSVSAEVET